MTLSRPFPPAPECHLCDNCTSNGEPNVDELSEDKTDGRALQVDERQEDADHDVCEHRAHASAENDATYLETNSQKTCKFNSCE